MVEPYRILIIEDDPEHAELIRMGFRRHDEFFLDFATTGEEGLEMIAGCSYDLISVDLVLPGIGGLDVLVRIRKFDPDIPVVMVSGHGTTEMAVVAFENRATKYVVKSMESFRSLPYIFENLILEARFAAQRRDMGARIERSERIHRNIVENALAGIYILQDGVFKQVNPKLGEIFGCASGSLIGMPFWELVRPDNMECISKLEQVGSAPAPVYESKVLRKDGTCRWIEFRTVPIEYEGRRAILGNLVDITPRKEQEIEILRNNRELTAINSIMARTLAPEGDLDRELADALTSVISGLENADLGGIFLREDSGLVLRALTGSVVELIDFIEDMESAVLLDSARVHDHAGEGTHLWMSAPLLCNGNAAGAIVIGCQMKGAGDISFLERAALQVGKMLETAILPEQGRATHEMLLPRIRSGSARD